MTYYLAKIFLIILTFFSPSSLKSLAIKFFVSIFNQNLLLIYFLYLLNYFLEFLSSWSLSYMQCGHISQSF